MTIKIFAHSLKNPNLSTLFRSSASAGMKTAPFRKSKDPHFIIGSEMRKKSGVLERGSADLPMTSRRRSRDSESEDSSSSASTIDAIPKKKFKSAKSLREAISSPVLSGRLEENSGIPELGLERTEKGINKNKRWPVAAILQKGFHATAGMPGGENAYQIEWETGEITWEPLKNIRKDVPRMTYKFDYALRKKEKLCQQMTSAAKDLPVTKITKEKSFVVANSREKPQRLGRRASKPHTETKEARFEYSP